MGLDRRYEAFGSLTAEQEGALIEGLKHFNECLEMAGIEGEARVCYEANGNVYSHFKINDKTEMFIALEDDWDKKVVEYKHNF